MVHEHFLCGLIWAGWLDLQVEPPCSDDRVSSSFSSFRSCSSSSYLPNKSSLHGFALAVLDDTWVWRVGWTLVLMDGEAAGDSRAIPRLRGCSLCWCGMERGESIIKSSNCIHPSKPKTTQHFNVNLLEAVGVAVCKAVRGDEWILQEAGWASFSKFMKFSRSSISAVVSSSDRWLGGHTWIRINYKVQENLHLSQWLIVIDSWPLFSCLRT